MISISKDEKVYAIEKGNKLVLVRGFHSERCPLTPQGATELARYVGEIGKHSKGWVAREIKDDAELQEVYDRLEQRVN